MLNLFRFSVSSSVVKFMLLLILLYRFIDLLIWWLVLIMW